MHVVWFSFLLLIRLRKRALSRRELFRGIYLASAVCCQMMRVRYSFIILIEHLLHMCSHIPNSDSLASHSLALPLSLARRRSCTCLGCRLLRIIVSCSCSSNYYAYVYVCLTAIESVNEWLAVTFRRIEIFSSYELFLYLSCFVRRL